MPRSSLFLLAIIIFFGCQQPVDQAYRQSGAGKAMDLWTLIRAYPQKSISTSYITKAFYESRTHGGLRNDDFSQWHNIGPKNIAGRILCLAVDPYSPDIIYAGSASGGLWKSVTGGVGEDAWEYIPTGYPVTAVSAIAIHPQNPDIIYIGTGEVYNAEAAHPGEVERFTRGTYGIGILRSLNGGRSWQQVLNWQRTDLKGVQELLIHPLHHNVIYAATTDGLMRSTNSGNGWQLIHDIPMATDVDIHPDKPDRIFVCYGSLNNSTHGIYRSEDGGDSFQFLSNGLTSFNGKARLDIHPDDPDLIVASLADELTGIGLFKSVDGGNRWLLVNNTNVASYQGWYSHDVAFHPEDQNKLLWAGIDVWRSENGGNSVIRASDSNDWYYGQTPAGGPEGTSRYVHADIHRIYFHPTEKDHVFFATDGGVFFSADGGLIFEGRNGGLITTQFYKRFSSSASNAGLAIGGMQDNGTAMYLGSEEWSRVLGGDGMSAAIYPNDEDVIFASLQNLEIRRTTNGGTNFFRVGPYPPDDELRCFNAPYTVSPADPDLIYAATDRIYRSNDRGSNWIVMDPDPIRFGDPVLRIFPSPFAAEELYVALAPVYSNTAGLFHSLDGGQYWDKVTGLPDRVCTDMAYDPTDPGGLWAVFSGYDTEHVFYSSDRGNTWENRDGNLPDLPVTSVAVHPEHPERIYLGTDIGVYFSNDQGEEWRLISQPAGDAIMVSDLEILADANLLRVITHGRGVFDVSLPEDLLSSNDNGATELESAKIWPNPAHEVVFLDLGFPGEEIIAARAMTMAGVTTSLTFAQRGTTIQCEVEGLAVGIYLLELTTRSGRRFVGRVIKK